VKGEKKQATEKIRTTTKPGPANGVKHRDHTVVNERTVSLYTGRTKVETTDYVAVKQKLQQGLDKPKVTQGLKIQFLRSEPGDKIDVVFQEKKQAEKSLARNRNWSTRGLDLRGSQPIPCTMGRAPPSAS
jgi:hypothetical protein